MHAPLKYSEASNRLGSLIWVIHVILIAATMGGVISQIRDGLQAVTGFVKAASSLNVQYQELIQRVSLDPGLPASKPTSSYWMDEPPFPQLSDLQAGLPQEADIVIIGSGITGAAAAKTICELLSSPSQNEGGGEGEGEAMDQDKPRIVVLEARQLCSGATARNGGHIKLAPHEDFARFRKLLGDERARGVVRFMLKHLEVLLEVGAEQPQGEVREVETVDFYVDDSFEEAKTHVEEMKEWLPEVEVTVWEGEAARTQVSR